MIFPKPAVIKGNGYITIGLDQLIPIFGIGDESLFSDPQKERIDEQNWGSVSKEEREKWKLRRPPTGPTTVCEHPGQWQPAVSPKC